MNLSEGEKLILSVFELYAKKPIAVYATAGALFSGGVLFLKNGIDLNSNGRVLVAGILFGLSIEGFIGAWAYPQLYSIIAKMKEYIRELEERTPGEGGGF